MTVSENDIENAKKRVAKMNERALQSSGAQECEEPEKSCESSDNSPLLLLVLFFLLSEKNVDNKTLLLLLFLLF